MKELSVDLTNCYGIKRLTYKFDFSNTNVFTIYGPNGSMKTSFAKTFKDQSNNVDSEDLVDKNNIATRVITDENGFEIENIFVIERLNVRYESDKRILLLVSADLQQQYQAAFKEIVDKEEELIAILRPLTGYTKSDLIIKEINDIYQQGTLLECMLWVRKYIVKTVTRKYGELQYRSIFNTETKELLNRPEIRQGLVEYIEKYNELVGQTKYLKPEFDHFGATAVQKALGSNGFFKANHSVLLKSIDGEEVINNDIDLQRVIDDEISGVIADQELKKRFDKIDSAFSKAGTRDFRTYLYENRAIIPELLNPEKLQKNIWNDYFSQPECYDKLVNYLSTHRAKKYEIQLIVDQARSQKSDWENVIKIFESRFTVPFKLKVSNREDVVLRSAAPYIEFIFEDTQGVSHKINENKLQEILCCGEQRALYLLNVIFELYVRIKQSQHTLLIVDDIADSFDYKNKYAIIEYLNDMVDSNNFNMIIMTHNFDFFRTIISRLKVKRNYNLAPIKTSEEIKLEIAYCQKTPFGLWMRGLHRNNKYLLSSIPYVRNLAEYTMNMAVYKELTQLLHIKPNTNSFTIKMLVDQYKLVCNLPNLTIANEDMKIMDILDDVTSEIIKSPCFNNLEDKVILAIAIRLKAEQFLLKKIKDTSSIADDEENPTIKLIELYEIEFADDHASIEILRQVILMTPENIHLNSFMYEPILDMDIDCLVRLYNKIPV